MMGSFTEFNNFFAPATEDSMADVEKNISDNFQIIEDSASVPVFAALPTEYDDFSVGDRIFVTGGPDPTGNSSYILLAKNTSWGMIWRPIQAAISPWTTPPVEIFNDPLEWGPDSFRPPFQFALCNRGYMHWRGSVSKQSGSGIDENTSFRIFNHLPVGAFPSQEGHITVAASPIGGKVNGVFRGGRVFISREGSITFRFWGCSSASDVYLSSVYLSIGGDLYFGP